MKIIDLTAPLSENTPVIKLPENLSQASKFSRKLISQYDERGEAFWNNFSMSEHTGTHFDAPIHWESGRYNIDVSCIPLEHLITNAIVINMAGYVSNNPDFLLEKEHIDQWCKKNGPVPKNSWLLYRTGWDKYGDDESRFLNNGHWPGISENCAKWIAQKTNIIGIGVETVGTDAGIAASFKQPFPVHWYMHGENKYGLAQLRNLHMLPSAGFKIIVSPLPIVGGSGSPCRVFALIDE